jgi:hypothetical protein
VLASIPGVYCDHSASWRTPEGSYGLAELERIVEEKIFVRDTVPLDDYFGRLAARGGAAVYGNVHRYHATAHRGNLQRFEARTAHVVVNMVRHPVTWVESGVAQTLRMAQAIPAIRHQVLGTFLRYRDLHRAFAAAHGLDSNDLEVQVWMFMCRRLEQLVRDVSFPNLEHVRMEDITTSEVGLGDLAERLVGNAVSVPADLGAKVFTTQPQHAHARRRAESPAALYAAWNPWQRALFDTWAQRASVWESHARFDYASPVVASGPGAR